MHKESEHISRQKEKLSSFIKSLTHSFNSFIDLIFMIAFSLREKEILSIYSKISSKSKLKGRIKVSLNKGGE